ncbi:MAG: PilZ domain-containing protein [Bdellovibrionales bacterium]|nr:PilZ domain-containing protein [Bdellovibrionales bacterium]
MMGSEGRDRRRFERIPLNLIGAMLSHSSGAQMIWPNLESSGIMDMSHSGLAATRPALQQLAIDQIYKVGVILGRATQLDLKVRVVWLREQLLGLELVETTVLVRARIDDFLQDRIIGRHIRSVASEHFAPGVGFQYWYHGPKDTNVYLWTDQLKNEIQRAEVEIDGEVLCYEKGKLSIGGEPSMKRIDRETPLLRRALEILSQIDESKGPMRQLLEALIRAD